ncbi:MAG TPA: site-specific integrase [Nitrospira sp.]|nr:site-specific integrase [Nitrospira sp.]
MLGLEWRAVDLHRQVLVVMKSKNGEKRTVPLNGCLVELLSRKAGSRATNSFVFSTSCGTRIDDRNLTRAFYSALQKAEITDFRFHDLRHTFATRLAQAGVDLYKVQRLLGHKSPSMTQRYAHHSPESLREGVLILERQHASSLSQIYHNAIVGQGQRVVSVGAGKGI